MQDRQVPTHYLRQNHRSWSPPHVIFVDTETETIQVKEPEIERLVLWCATAVMRRTVKRIQPREISALGTKDSEFIEWLEVATRSIQTTWVYAHNLSFDLITLNVLKLLPQAGWELTDNFSTSAKAPFFRFKKGYRRLVFTDSWSWLPHSLAKIGEAVHIKKPPLPPVTEWDALVHRCKEDVRILQAAIIELMEWWDNEELGNWSITGASCGWSAFRHTIRQNAVIIDTDPEAVKHDTTAIYGGRRDCWRLGAFTSGPYIEIDFKSAYPTIAATLPLPRQRYALRDGKAINTDLLHREKYGYIARCIVKTDVPRYPWKHGKAVWYPVGTFETTLAAPELQYALEHGDLLEIKDGRPHGLSHYMASWGRWILDTSGGNTPDTLSVASIATKAWGRSVIGKFAGRTSTLVGKKPSEYNRYMVIEGYNRPRHARARWIVLNGTEYEFIIDQWSENAYPAVWAFVESYVRVALNTVIDSLPEHCLMVCNTDGIILDSRRLDSPKWRRDNGIPFDMPASLAIDQWCVKISKATAPLEIRVKKYHDSINIFGPAQLDMADESRWIGVNKGANRVSIHEWEARSWPKLNYQLSQNAISGYVNPLKRISMPGPFAPRWVYPDSTLRSIECRITPDGSTEILPMDTGYWHHFPELIEPLQHPKLREYI